MAHTLSDVLAQLYKDVVLGASLENEGVDYVCQLVPAVPGHCCPFLPATATAPPGLGGHLPDAGAHERVLLQLTVIQVMVTRVLSAETHPRTRETYREILNLLLKSSELNLKLTFLLPGPEKLLSHMAAKCLALLLYFQLQEEVPLSQSWVTFCHKSLCEPLGSRPEACLWVLSAIIREAIRDPCPQKSELLTPLLTPLATALDEFYDGLFTQLPDSSKGLHVLLAALDLLELLVAARIRGHWPNPCQRLISRTPFRMLDIIAWPVPAFVRRKCIVFLKKCLLCKVGEDLGPASVPVPQLPDPGLAVDTAALADVVLRAVDSGLLRTLPAPGKAARFGGDEIQPSTCSGPGTDQVLLRAASLLITKSLEIRLQHCASAKEMKGDVQRLMAQLLDFLKSHLPPTLQRCHPCAWLSWVFIEQDDDMLEAARAFLSIYLQVTRADDTPGQGQPGGAAWAHHSHNSGCNPHCAFLFLLGTLGFDATTLLDFLISSETCFLEYLVRYLKLLHKDWSDFVSVCAQLGSSAKPGWEGVGGARDRGSLPSPACVARSLVAYDSSDDSEGESSEQLLSTGELEAQETTEAGVAGEGEDLLSRTMRCLSHLHGAILRLQQKTLFPYNPAALRQESRSKVTKNRRLDGDWSNSTAWRALGLHAADPGGLKADVLGTGELWTVNSEVNPPPSLTQTWEPLLASVSSRKRLERRERVTGELPQRNILAE